MTGEKRQPAGYSFQTDNYDLFQVICVTRGRLYFKTDGRECALSVGQAVVLWPGSAFALRCRGRGYEGVFYIAAPQEVDAAKGQSCVVGPDNALRQLAGMLAKELTGLASASVRLRDSLSEALAWQAVALAKQLRPVAATAEQYGQYWAELTADTLAGGLYSRREPADILAGLPLSYRQLARYLHLHTGCSPMQYLQNLREKEARRMLEETEVSITSISYELGFSSSQHFSCWFRRRTGVTPSGCRAKP